MGIVYLKSKVRCFLYSMDVGESIRIEFRPSLCWLITSWNKSIRYFTKVLTPPKSPKRCNQEGFSRLRSNGKRSFPSENQIIGVDCMEKNEIWEMYNIILEWMHEIDRFASGKISTKYSRLQEDIRIMLDFLNERLKDNG